MLDAARYSPVIIVSCCLLSCALLWLLVLQYAIRLGINNDVRLIVIVLVCVDAILEFGAAIMLIISNLYCTEILSLPMLFGFSYTYLAIIGAVFLVIFDLLLLLVAGVIFFGELNHKVSFKKILINLFIKIKVRKKKKNMFIFNNLK